MALTALQSAFVAQFLVDLNATQAAIRAGYSERTARSMGSENLSKPDIQEAIATAQRERAERVRVDSDWVLSRLVNIADADPRRLMSWGPGGMVLRASSELTDEEAALVAEIGSTTTKDGGSMRIKLHDKRATLVDVGRHLGMFPNKVEMTGKDGGPIQTQAVERDLSGLSREEKEKLLALLEKAEAAAEEKLRRN